MKANIRPRREALKAAMMVFIVAVSCNVAVSFVARKGLKEEIQHHVMYVAKAAAEFTNGDLHQTITKPEQKGSADYLEVQAPYRKLLAADSEFSYIYTTILKDNKIHFIIDTQQQAGEPKQDDTAAIMQIYDKESKMIDALREKRAIVEDKPYSDEWGTFLSAYVPVYNSKNEFLGIVGADLDASEYKHKLLWIWLASGIGAFIAFGLSVGVYFVVKRIRTEHLQEEEVRAERLGLMQDFNSQMQNVASSLSDTSVKITEMANSISDMTAKSAEKTDEAKKQIYGAGERIQSIEYVCNKLVSSTEVLQKQAYDSQRATSDAVKQLEVTNKASNNLLGTANNITQIIGMIAEITEKIDLLALNATIEAARAGEAGKGFAVVADEVKMLSQQTASATKQINEYIVEIQSAAQIVVSAFDGVSGKVNAINEAAASSSKSIEGQKELIGLINTDVTEVSQSAKVMEDTVGAVAGIANQTKDRTRSLYEAVNVLSRQNQTLNMQVSDFLRDLENAAGRKKLKLFKLRNK